MKAVYLAVAAGALLAGGGEIARPTIGSRVAESPVTPLILEQNEGEHRVWRPIEGAPGWKGQPGAFILKVDPQNGGSSHLVFVTEDLPPGAKIDTHNHPGSDEIVFLQNGTAHVDLGTAAREVHAGATVFIPAHTWISITNTGRDPIHLVAVFSAPGFEGYMRAESVPEGQPPAVLSKAQDAAIARKYGQAVIYRE